MRHILHADFDAFYASIEQLDNPELKGKPVVVGGSADSRGVVASASYEARAYGIRSAMPMRTAFQRCPHAIRIGAHFDRYGDVSKKVMSIFRDITPLVEPLSLDEAFLDITDVVTDERGPGIVAAELRVRVRDELSLTISVGVATSKSVAKIASDIDKPDGLTIVPPGTERDFLAPLDVGKLWGVGPKTAERLAKEGVLTIKDLAARDSDWFTRRFGKVGPYTRRLALGQDNRAVVTERESKSVSAETTLAEDTGDAEALTEIVSNLSRRVGRHLERGNREGTTVKLKLRLSDFTTFTRQRTLSGPVNSEEVISEVAAELLRAEMAPDRTFRLVGVGVSGFTHEEDGPESPEAQPRLEGFE